MRQSIFAVALLTTLAVPAAAQGVVLPVLGQGGPVAALTTPVFSALPAPLGAHAALPVDVTVLQNGSNGSGVNQVLGLGGNHATTTLIGNSLNNTIGTPLLGLPSGSARPVDVAVLGGDEVGNSNAGGVAGIAALSGSQVAHGGLAGVGVLNRDHSGSGRLVGVAALSGRHSGHASQGLGVGALNRGETLGVSAGGRRVLTLGGLTSQAGAALPGLDVAGVALAGGRPVASSNPLINAGVLAGDHAGNGGLVGVAALSGRNAANAQLVGVGVLNQSGSGKGVVGVDVLSSNGSGVSSRGAGVAVLSGRGSGTGGVAGAGVLTDSHSGQGGVLGAGVLSGSDSGQSNGAGVAALSGARSGTGGAMGGNVVSSNNAGTGSGGGPGTGDGAGAPGAGGGDTGGGVGNGAGNSGNGNGANDGGNAGGNAGGSRAAGGAYAYNGSGEPSRVSARASKVCKLGDKDASGRMIRAEHCATKVALR